MKRGLFVMALCAGFGAQAALALTTDEVIADLTAQGYTRVEVKVGPSQIKAEAIRGTEKLELIYDSATGTLLKSEAETVRSTENTTAGVTVRERSRDFVRVVRTGGTGVSDDDSDDSGKGRGRGRGRGGDDNDDDSSDDSSSDDSSDDSSSDDSDDDSDDDNSGSGHGGGHGGGSDDDSDDSDDDSDDSSDD